MKKILLLLTWVIMCIGARAADEITTTIDDFESGDKGWVMISNVSMEIIDNPLKSGINTSDKVMKLTRYPTGDWWAGAILRDQAALTIGSDIGDYRFVYMKVLKGSNGGIGFKVERGGNDVAYESTVDYNPNGKWQEVVIDMAGAGSRVFTDYFVMPEITNLGSEVIVYIDDIQLKTDPNAREDEVLPGEWQLLFEDNFNGDSYDTSIWDPQVSGGGFGNNEKQYYTDRADNLFTRDGCLVIRALKETYNNHAYTSAKIWTQFKKNFKYGKVEARFKVPEGRGTWPAIWMMPTNSVYGVWPNSGEIDIMEYVGYDPNYIHGTLHRKAGSGGNGDGNKISIEGGAYQDFHEIVIEWEPSFIKWYLDGEHFHTYRKLDRNWEYWPFDEEFYLIMNFAVGGDWGGAQGIDDTIWPREFLVDYVRVYQKDGEVAIKKTKNNELFSILHENDNTILVLSDTAKNVSVDIYSLTGTHLLGVNNAGKEERVNTSSLSQGVYLISVSDGERVYSEKFIKR